MAGFGLILGGAMSGWSDARLDQIKAEREARLQEVEAQRQDRRLADEREFRSREAEIGRNFEAGENEKTRAANKEDRQSDQAFRSGEADKSRTFEAGQNETERTYRSGESQKERDFRSGEAEKARDASGDLITDDKGNSYSRVGARATPLTDDKGNPVKAASGKAADKPAEVSTAEWLIQQGVAPDASSAWKMVRSARADPEKSRASIYKAWLDALTKGQLGTPDAAELESQARAATEKTLQYLDEEGGNGDSGARSETSGAAEAPPAPRDPAQRKVGTVYSTADGRKVKWTGEGWELVQ